MSGLRIPPNRRLGWRCLVGVALVTCLAYATESLAQGDRYALLIGIDEYQSFSDISELEYAEADVVELSQVLGDQGFDVVELTNFRATREEIVRELVRLSLKLDSDDDFLLYFSGHGIRNVRINQQAYWLTYRTDLNFLEVEGIRLSHLLDFVADIKAGRKLVLLDHCYSGDLEEVPASAAGTSLPPDLDATAPPGSGGTRAPDRSLGLVRGQALDADQFEASLANPPTGLVILAASRDLALESGVLGHGVFTQAVLEALRDLKADTSDTPDKVTAFEFISYVESRVPTLAQQHHFRQAVVPKFSGVANLNDWVLAVNRGSAITLAAATSLAADYKQRLQEMLRRRRNLGSTQKHKWDLLLDRWLDSLTSGVELSEDDPWLVQQIRRVMSDDTMSEADKEQALNDVFS